MLRRYLLHEKLFVRFASLWAMVFFTFILTWTLSYFFLPEGVLRGKNLAFVLAGDDLAGGSVWLEGVRIFAINLSVMVLLVIGPNLLRDEKGYPLGYMSATVVSLIYAVVLGTDSFTLSQGGKIAPTWEIFTRSGIYEITAYILAATATYGLSRYQLQGQWPKQTVTALQGGKPSRETAIGVALAVLILLAANAFEAYRVMLYLAS